MDIGSKYRIESDSMNITLYQKYTTKKGEERWRAIGYFSTVGNALKGLVDLKLKESGMKDFKSIVKTQKDIYNLIESVAKKLSAV